ncbi:DUF1016 domain-containing protein [Prevotella sp. AM34-19LB]|jgi:predicted nuclease of restriction endonuclease-like (RecB) superfamily|uniref:PDDEXK nuclease domain-containing protein n=1 Tax=Prevotella sp. AM34-19LB TaxID=2292364 RepID=UPI000E5D9BBC|nr:PDDEXK nuclease domain-containing protein [Prevotella sp. AM34-19LB]RHC76457.1 DUF1016 domain-containing protein [Prevotella sp. AM34-19LB]
MNKPEFTYNQGIVPSVEYHEWLKSLKLRYKDAQIKASVKVNSELIRFYWSLGKDIVAMKVEDHWGKGVLNQLSLDLKDTFPQQNGFSVTNLKYMKRWYSFYAQSDEIRHQLGDELEFPANFSLVPWRHHISIFTKSNSVKEALFYINKTIEGNWSRSTLENKMEEKLYVKQGCAVTNFSSKLPAAQSKLAEEVLKDPYKLDFLHLKEDYDEKDLEDALAHNITRFLLELGQGFAYVGRQMELRMPGGQSFYPDMIFYHIHLKCYVVIELKVVKFIPEFAGKLNFYVSAADHLLKKDDDNPSIGLLICKSKDDTVVKWSFEDINKPIGVSTYQLQEIVDQTIISASKGLMKE